jgi:hypothetical protein
MHTNKLIGPALDWAVNHVEGLTGVLAPVNYCKWEHGGPIIEREKLGVWFSENSVDEEGNLLGVAKWYAEDKGGDHVRTGATPLIAAMRCYVASKLGDNIEVPEGLT